MTPLAVNKRKPLTWAEAKGFAHDVCQEMARDNPDLYLIKMTKSLEGRADFLDYLGNDRMATAVAPLSPRARPSAIFSMRLTWTQVKSDLDPKRFTIRARSRRFWQRRPLGRITAMGSVRLSRRTSGSASRSRPHDI